LTPFFSFQGDMSKIGLFLQDALYINVAKKDNQRSLIIVFLLFALALSLIESVIVEDPAERWMLYGFSGLMFFSLLLAYRNVLLPGRVLAPLGGFMVITIFLVDNGIRDEALGGYYLVLMVAGLVLGDAGLIFFGSLSTLGIVVIGYMEYEGWIVSSDGRLTDPSVILTSALFMLGTVLALHFLVRLLHQEAGSAHKNELAQQAANEDLRSLKSELEERVNQRTAELQSLNEKMTSQLQEINRLQDELREEAIRDPLTGLFNRRYLEATLIREIARAQREEYDISFLLLDIDFFKHFNDLYGHSAGDLVLKTLSERLNYRVRFSDIPCRLGGEEFLLVLPGVPEEVALLRAEYFRDQIESMPIPHGTENLNLTISIGVACYPKHGKIWEELYGAVDRALYRAKQNGRNRVETA